MQKETNHIELESVRKELTMVHDQNSKLLEQLKDGNDREIVLKQKSAALSTSNKNLHKDLRDVSILKFIFRQYNI